MNLQAPPIRRRSRPTWLVPRRVHVRCRRGDFAPPRGWRLRGVSGLDRITTRFALLDRIPARVLQRGLLRFQLPCGLGQLARARGDSLELIADLGERRQINLRVPRLFAERAKGGVPLARELVDAASNSTSSDRIDDGFRSTPRAGNCRPRERSCRSRNAGCVSGDARHRALDPFALCETLTRIGTRRLR